MIFCKRCGIKADLARGYCLECVETLDNPAFKQDDLLTWKMKVAAIWHVYQFGGRVTLFDADNKKFIVERRPDEVLKQIKSTISKIFEHQMA